MASVQKRAVILAGIEGVDLEESHGVYGDVSPRRCDYHGFFMIKLGNIAIIITLKMGFS